MIGAIAGDLIGSVHECTSTKTKDFPLFHEDCRFTDDTVLTVAIAKAILDEGEYLEAVRTVGRRYPHCGYGAHFTHWLFSEDPRPYNSWGNGSAMRVSPVGFAFDDPGRVLDEAARTAAISHDHPEGIKGAQATALAVFLARTTKSMDRVRQEIGDRFDYDLARTVGEIRPSYEYDISCQGTVPEAIIAFLDSDSYEDGIRNAVSLGGDADTLACITGGIAEAYYGTVPEAIREKVLAMLTPELRSVCESFYERFDF